ncbi:MAG TPA: glycoside hydrolase family 3 C-terminal domain-containing protein [Polyangiaceae bacterium]|nr:glycoside hydrolase family 3 C-terminal domain-containing protein [Polyangiaceae bacterium]
MGQHELSIARRRRFFRRSSLVALGIAFAAVACGNLQPETTPMGGDDGGSQSSGSGSGSATGSGSNGGSGTGSSSGNVSTGSGGNSGSGSPGGTSSTSGGGSGSGSGGGSGSSSSGGQVMVVALDGSPPDVAKIACMDSTEALPHTPGYTPDPAVTTQVTTLVSGITSNTQLANQMRGTVAASTNFSDVYRTPDDMTNGIKGFLFRDGPRGVNLPAGQNGLNYGSGYSTAFPVPVLRAASWDLDLEKQVGADMGDETLGSGNTMLLAPVVNILRHPAWGRAQETYGEDSFLLGRFGSAFTEGLQQYVPGCVKHYAANNIEDGRASQNAMMDEQTLHEIYGRQFEMVIQDGGVACVMAAYNEINGTKCAQNKELLTDMLRTTFGFQGFVLSDWWAMTGGNSTSLTTQAEQTTAQQGLTAGLDMETPWSLNYSTLEAFATLQQLQVSSKRIIDQKFRFKVNTVGVPVAKLGLKAPSTSLNSNGITGNEAHIADALQSAEEGMVLLQNQKNTLPISRTSVHTIAVIGAAAPWTLSGTTQTGTVNFATDVRLGDLGSSRVSSDPAKSVGPAAGIAQAAGAGITVTSGTAATLADNADFVVVVAGLTPQDEGEEYTGAGDRTDTSGNPNLALDAKVAATAQNALITTIAAKGKPMVVVLEGGSAIDMPWLASVPAVVMAWYPGMVGGEALGKLLFGDVNFSGKLPITWPKTVADEPPFNQGGTKGGTTMMDYYLGYRYFDKNAKTPLFAFGSGLSYTTFQYQFLGLPCSTVTKKGVVDVVVEITNTGTVAGSDVAFLFVSYPSTAARRSVKELKGFYRTPIVMPGATVQFKIPLRIADLKYWNTTSTPPGWTVESGPVQVMVGPSSDNLPLKDMLTVQ